ncbi:MAG: multidrug ABC transporter ATP-binding protein, partial [Phycisphaerae bacterium]
AALLLQKLPGVRSIEEQDGAIVLELDEQTHDFSHIASALVKNNFKIREIKEEEVNLETAFMRLTKGLVQ